MVDSPPPAALSADAAVSAWLEGYGARTSSMPTGFGAILLECWHRADAEVQGHHIEPRAFLRHVGSLLGGRPWEDLAEAVGALRWEELYVAYAAASGCGHALRRLESRYLSDAIRALGSRGLGAAERDDVLQQVRAIMLGTGSGTPAKLLTFRGQGPLSRWIRITTVRCVRPKRREDRVSETLLSGLPDLVLDPELTLAAGQTRVLLEGAFEAAVERLDAQDRLVLKQWAVDGLSIDELGRLHDVHRSTAARWLGRIRQALLHETKNHLALEQGLDAQEVDSLVRRAQSQIDVTMERALGQ